MAFMFIAIHHPKPEHRDDVLQSMTRVGDALRGSSGLLQIGPWQEEEGNRLIGLSIWESREAFELALRAVGRFGRSPEDWEERPAEEIFAVGKPEDHR
jgi:heme-degrading monooxygenase HmoA